MVHSVHSVSKKQTAAMLDSTSGLHFHLLIVIDLPFCIELPNCIQIEPVAADITRYANDFLCSKKALEDKSSA